MYDTRTTYVRVYDRLVCMILKCMIHTNNLIILNPLHHHHLHLSIVEQHR